jgi:acetyltransferase-like isoleucine patch superfamily enzyme
MKRSSVDPTSKIINSTISKSVGIREYCTIHDSKIGDGCRIYERVSIKKGKLGKKVDINAGTYIEFADIEDEVQVGPNCSIVGIFHKFSKKGAERKDSFKKVKIGKGAFVGAGCIILPGREIGRGSVVGAGAVITENIPSYHIVIGTFPDQTVKSLKEWLH